MKLHPVAVAATMITLSACSKASSSPGVPSLPAGSGRPSTGSSANPNAVTGDGSAARRTALHNAAECIRQHGAPRYQDPVLTADGRVYTDEFAVFSSLNETQLDALETACGELIRAAEFAPGDQAPPPPKLVQAGVKSAECFRAHGLPDYKDPTVNSHFIPGKGFGLDASGIPGAGQGDAKQNPTVRDAITACRSVLDEEARLSSLGSLADA
ncbi:hypothetical protein OG799_15125 [Micromonospora sp. NBC_00898]|uniref:hypothetical protein n=1 Tax=Micromonospora sp. NBC_00898 TaxID=2975981 RepID=UPI0038655644|nr:hypothetical protein OG799_15125 [Micromonospora sp. NBC_00898]